MTCRTAMDWILRGNQVARVRKTLDIIGLTQAKTKSPTEAKRSERSPARHRQRAVRCNISQPVAVLRNHAFSGWQGCDHATFATGVFLRASRAYRCQQDWKPRCCLCKLLNRAESTASDDIIRLMQDPDLRSNCASWGTRSEPSNSVGQCELGPQATAMPRLWAIRGVPYSTPPENAASGDPLSKSCQARLNRCDRPPKSSF